VADQLLDTGTRVALLDRRERDHPRCVQTLQGFSGCLISTEAVLSENLDLDGMFTLDRHGFGVYRLHGRRAFQIVP
jgi:hypothetical protein